MSAGAIGIPSIVTPEIRRGRADMHDRVLTSRSLKDGSKTVYTVILRFCYAEGVADATIGTLATKAGMSSAKFRRYLEPLKEKYVWWTRTGRANRWSIEKPAESRLRKSERSDRSTGERSLYKETAEIFEIPPAAVRSPIDSRAAAVECDFTHDNCVVSESVAAKTADDPERLASTPVSEPPPETPCPEGKTAELPAAEFVNEVCDRLERIGFEPDPRQFRRHLAGATRDDVERAFAQFARKLRSRDVDVGLFVYILDGIKRRPRPAPPPTSPEPAFEPVAEAEEPACEPELKPKAEPEPPKCEPPKAKAPPSPPTEWQLEMVRRFCRNPKFSVTDRRKMAQEWGLTECGDAG